MKLLIERETSYEVYVSELSNSSLILALYRCIPSGAWLLMVIPRSRSSPYCQKKSNDAFLTSSNSLLVAPSKRSTDVLFQWSICAIMPQKNSLCVSFSVNIVICSLWALLRWGCTLCFVGCKDALPAQK
jgi:hypothetical protein